jgi:hypothetical protein
MSRYGSECKQTTGATGPSTIQYNSKKSLSIAKTWPFGAVFRCLWLLARIYLGNTTTILQLPPKPTACDAWKVFSIGTAKERNKDPWFQLNSAMAHGARRSTDVLQAMFSVLTVWHRVLAGTISGRYSSRFSCEVTSRPKRILHARTILKNWKIALRWRVDVLTQLYSRQLCRHSRTGYAYVRNATVANYSKSSLKTVSL